MIAMNPDSRVLEIDRGMLSIPATLVCRGAICAGLYVGGEHAGIRTVPEFEEAHVSSVASEMIRLAHQHHQSSLLPAFVAKRFNLKPRRRELKRLRERQRAGLPPPPDAYPEGDSRPYTVAGKLTEGALGLLLPFNVTSHTWRCESPATVKLPQDTEPPVGPSRPSRV